MLSRKIYIASSWSNRYNLRNVRDRLEKAGHRVIARWIDVDEVDYPAPIGAERDLEDLYACDTLVFWPDNLVNKTSGKYVEYGFALGVGHDIFIVEPDTCTCIFTQLAPTWQRIKKCKDFEELYTMLGA